MTTRQIPEVLLARDEIVVAPSLRSCHDQSFELPTGIYVAMATMFFGFVAVAAYFLIAEHRAHIVPFLPLLLLAACPLMHLFHHGGHKRGGDEESKPGSRPPSSSGGGAHQH